jgi:hypothetical protein
MGAAGSDTALETADIALMSDDLMKLPYSIRLSRKALSTIRQNITFSLAVIGLLISTALLGWLKLSLGVFGHEPGVSGIRREGLPRYTAEVPRLMEPCQLFLAAPFERHCVVEDFARGTRLANCDHYAYADLNAKHVVSRAAECRVRPHITL